jgi:hypothetical protein
MPIRNVWSLEPGECITAERILEEVEDCAVYFPLHDAGIDLLVVRGKDMLGFKLKNQDILLLVR